MAATGIGIVHVKPTLLWRGWERSALRQIRCGEDLPSVCRAEKSGRMFSDLGDWVALRHRSMDRSLVRAKVDPGGWCGDCSELGLRRVCTVSVSFKHVQPIADELEEVGAEVGAAGMEQEAVVSADAPSCATHQGCVGDDKSGGQACQSIRRESKPKTRVQNRHLANPPRDWIYRRCCSHACGLFCMKRRLNSLEQAWVTLGIERGRQAIR